MTLEFTDNSIYDLGIQWWHLTIEPRHWKADALLFDLTCINSG